MALKITKRTSEDRFLARGIRILEDAAGLLPGSSLSPEDADVVAAGFAVSPIKWDAETFQRLGLDPPVEEEGFMIHGMLGDASEPMPLPEPDPAVVTAEDVETLATPVSERRAMAAVVGGRPREVKHEQVYDVV
jgi:hypothetical protein